MELLNFRQDHSAPCYMPLLTSLKGHRSLQFNTLAKTRCGKENTLLLMMMTRRGYPDTRCAKTISFSAVKVLLIDVH